MIALEESRARWHSAWLKWRPPRLHFDDEQEARFIEAFRDARVAHFLRSGVVALLVYDLFILSDRMMAPDVFEQALWIRLGLFSPFALALLLFTWLMPGVMRRLPAWVPEFAVALSGVMAAASLCVVLVQTTSPWGTMYRAGLVPILVYGNVVQRFRFRFASVFTLFVLAVYAISVVAVMGRPHPFPALEVPMALLVTAVGGYTLLINFRLELEERRRFSRTERARQLREQLRASQHQLAEQSRQDPLTGLPNRRSFDDTLMGLWSQHRQTGRSLAFALIDVDHFKAYNDRYGHLAGDHCLKLVAQVIRERCTALGGFAARWGGEEFVVIWPDMDVARARRYSEELTAVVRQMGLRHEASLTGDTVTVSVGVALARPAQTGLRVEEVLAAADAALYRAKQGGRNRCDIDPMA
jgi:diguanylate cyclase (GGDEF)-like protein